MVEKTTEYDFCPECDEKVEPVPSGTGHLAGIAWHCPDCETPTIYKPLYRFEVTRHVWKYCTVEAGDKQEASDIADDEGEWEESPDYDDTVGEANLGGN